MAHIPSIPTLFDERSGANRAMLPAPPRRIRLTLRSQVLLVLILLLVVASVVYVGMRRSVLNSFDDLQRDSIQRDTQRVLNALSTQLESLDDLARNWAASPDVMAAIQGDSAPLAAEMNDATLRDFNLNILLVLNMQGDLAFGRVYDADSGQGLTLSPMLAKAYLGISGLGFDMTEVAGYTDGVLQLPTIDLDELQAQAEMLVPQLDQFLSDSSGVSSLDFNISGNSALFAHEIILGRNLDEPAGILILGQLMPPSAVEQLGQTTQTRVAIMTLGDVAIMPTDFRAAYDALMSGQSSYERVLSDEYAAGYSLLSDMRGQPALILRVETERRFTQRALQLANQIFGGAVLVALAVLGLVALMLELAVIRRILGLSRFVRGVGESGDISLRTSATGHDELADLGANINVMLGSLQQSQQLLSDNRLQLEQILASISDIVYMVELSPQGEILRHRIPSPQIAALTGYPQAQFDADFAFWQSLIVPDDLPSASGYLDHPVPYNDSQSEYRMVNAAGVTYWIRDRRHLRPVPNSDRVIVYGVLSDITAQKAAEVELAAERNLLRTVIDIQLHSVYVKDRERRIVLCNPSDAAWRKVATPDDALGKSDEAFYPPEVAAKFAADDLYVMEHDLPVINREEPAPLGNELHWLLTTKVPLHDAEGRVIGLVGVGQDITGRKQMEEELRRAKEELEGRVEQRTAELAYERNLLRTLIDAVPDHVFIKDTASRFLTMNRAAAVARGYSSPEEAVGSTDFDHFDADVAQGFRGEEVALMRGDVDILSGERPIVERDPAGQLGGWYWTIKVPFRNADGTVAGLVGIGRDISDRKRLEEELRGASTVLEQRVRERTADLRAALSELRQSEERFEQAFMFAPMGISLVTLEGRFMKVNPAMAEMIGYEAETLEAMAIADVTFPDDRGLTTKTLDLAPLGPNAAYYYEQRYMHYDGHIIWAAVTVSLVRHADGSPAYMVAQVQNITDRKYAEAEREALIQKIQTRANELATSAEISRQATTILDIDRLLKTTVGLIAHNFDFYNVVIYRPHDNGQWLVPAAGTGIRGEVERNPQYDLPIRLGAEVSLIAKAARTREPVLSNDTLNDPTYLQHPLLTGTRAELVLPMIVGDELVGILDIQDDKPERFTTDDVNILVTLAAQLANALHIARLFTENGRRLAVIEHSADLIALCKMQEPLTVNYINPAGARMVGAKSSAELVNRRVGDFYTLESRERLRNEALPIVLAQGAWRGEQVMLRVDGSTFPVELTLLAIPGQPGQLPDLATINTDITQRKQWEMALHRANRAYRVLSECNQAMVHAESETKLLDEICQIIVRESGYHSAWVAYATQDLTPEGTFTGELMMDVVSFACADHDADVFSDFTVTQARIDTGLSPSGMAMQSRQPIVFNNLVDHPGYAVYWSWINKMGYSASITLPLLLDGRPVGVFNVYSRESDAFDQGEMNLLVELAGDMAYGIAVQRARREREEAQEKLREANIKLAQSNRSLLTLHEVGRTLTTALDPATIYDVLYWALLHPLYSVPTCLVSLYDAASGAITCAYACVDGNMVPPDSVPVQSVDVGVQGEVIRTREPRLIPYAASVPDAPETGVDSPGAATLPLDLPLTLATRPAVGVVVPLISGDQVLGVLHILHADATAITDEDIPLLSVMANQTAAALQNAQLFAAERQQRTMAEALSDVATAINSTLDLTAVMDCILDNIQNVVPHDTASIMLVEGGRGRIMRHKGFIERGLGDAVSDLSFVTESSPKFSQMHLTGQPVIIADVSQSEWWVQVPGLEWVRGHMGSPILLGDELLGVINLDSAIEGFFTAESARRLQAFADQASVAIQNARLFAAERKQRMLAEALRDITATINSTLSVDRTLALILDNVGIVVPHTAANIMLVDHNSFYVAAHRGYDEHNLADFMEHWRRPLSTRQILVRQMERGEPLLINDTRNFAEWVYEPGDEWIRSMLTMPIQVDGQSIGMLNLDHSEPNAFTLEHVERLQVFVTQASTAMRNAQLYAAEREQRVFAEALSDTAATINRILDPGAVMDRILDNIAQVIPYDAATIMVVDDDGTIRTLHHRGYHERGADDWLARWVQHTSTLWFWPDLKASGEIAVYNDVRQSAGWMATRVDATAWIGSSIKAPIVVEGRVAGIINLDCAAVDAFSSQQITRLRSFADQAANALHNARLFTDEREQRVLAEALRDTAEAINSSLNFDTVLNRILTSIQHVIPYDTASITMLKGGVLEMTQNVGYSKYVPGDWVKNWRAQVDKMPYTSRMRDTGQPVVIRDTRTEPQWTGKGSPKKEWVLSTVKAPIFVDGEFVGAIHLESTQINAFDDRDGMRLMAFVNQAASALRNARLYAAESEQHDFSEALSDMAATVNQVLELDAVLDRILEHLQQVLPHDAANVMFVDDGVARIVRGHGYAERGLGEWIEQLRFTVSEVPIWQRLLATHQPFTIPDTRQDDDWMRFAGPEESWIRSTVKAPILIDDQLIGILHIDSATPNTFGASHAERLQAFAHHAANAIRNARLFAAERDQRTFAEALSDSAAAINSTIQHDEVLDRVLINVERIAPYDTAEILLIDGDEVYMARGWQSWPNVPLSAVTVAGIPRVRITDMPNLRWMAETGQPNVVGDTRDKEDWVLIPGWEWIRSQASAPIKRQDHVIGFVMLNSAQPGFYTPAVAERLQAFVDQAALALFNADLYARVQNYAEEQKQAVLEATAELAAQHAQLQTILDTMAEGLIFSIDSNFKYANRACEELLGRPVSSLNDGFMHVVEMLGPLSPKAQDVQGRIIRTLAHGRTWQGELSLVRADGREFDAAVSVTPVPGPNDEQPTGQLTMIRDVSQEKALHAQRDRFIAHASHELRTPLANIKTRLYLLKNQPDKLNQHMAILERVSNDMNELIENLLDVSRFERGVNTLALRSMVLQDLLRDTVMIQQAEAELKHITLVADLPETPFNVLVDPNRMRQVFTNLITNAINYTPEGGSVTVSVAADPAQLDRRVICRVRDTGVGIDPEQVKHVFEPFFRANQGMATGTGLGLSIAKEITELHQGEITADSTPGEGSTFSVTLDLIE